MKHLKARKWQSHWYSKEKGDRHLAGSQHISKSSHRYLEGGGVERSLDRMFGIQSPKVRKRTPPVWWWT